MDPNFVIDAFGGTSKVAKLFDIKPPSVSEWRESGIPRARLMCLRLMRPEVFRQDEPKQAADQESLSDPAEAAA